MFFLCTTTATAQPKVTFAAPKNGRIDSLIPVMAQSARCAALSDVHGMLAFGHEHTYPAAHVSVVKLDAKGNPAAYTIPIKLPRPAGLEKFPNYPVSMAFHPKLPLLYVWQDIQLHYTNPPPPVPPETKAFDHVLVYNVARETPELLVSFCRGFDYIYGQHGGGIAVDNAGSYLYVSNLREPKNAGSLRSGRFPLDADGLPMLSAKDAKEPLTVRAKRLMEVNATKPLLPPELTPIEYVNLFGYNGYGSLTSFYPMTKDVVIAAGWRGLVTWRPDDKNVTISALPLKHVGSTQIVGHPTLPVVFASVEHHFNLDSFYRVEHVEGYLTLLPRQYVIPESRLSGPPAILTKQKKLAIGGQHYVYQVSLDDKGFPTGEVVRTQVLCPAVRALVYSEKFDRLYVGVELSK